MTNDVDWKAPPSRKRDGAWVARLLPLMERPTEWALVATYETQTTASSTVGGLRKGRLRIPEGRWDFRSSGADVFARYLGPTLTLSEPPGALQEPLEAPPAPSEPSTEPPEPEEDEPEEPEQSTSVVNITTDGEGRLFRS